MVQLTLDERYRGNPPTRGAKDRHGWMNADEHRFILWGLKEDWSAARIGRALGVNEATVRRFRARFAKDPELLLQLGLYEMVGRARDDEYRCLVCGEQAVGRTQMEQHVLRHFVRDVHTAGPPSRNDAEPQNEPAEYSGPRSSRNASGLEAVTATESAQVEQDHEAPTQDEGSEHILEADVSEDGAADAPTGQTSTDAVDDGPDSSPDEIAGARPTADTTATESLDSLVNAALARISQRTEEYQQTLVDRAGGFASDGIARRSDDQASETEGSTSDDAAASQADDEEENGEPSPALSFEETAAEQPEAAREVAGEPTADAVVPSKAVVIDAEAQYAHVSPDQDDSARLTPEVPAEGRGEPAAAPNHAGEARRAEVVRLVGETVGSVDDDASTRATDFDPDEDDWHGAFQRLTESGDPAQTADRPDAEVGTDDRRAEIESLIGESVMSSELADADDDGPEVDDWRDAFQQLEAKLGATKRDAPDEPTLPTGGTPDVEANASKTESPEEAPRAADRMADFAQLHEQAVGSLDHDHPAEPIVVTDAQQLLDEHDEADEPEGWHDAFQKLAENRGVAGPHTAESSPDSGPVAVEPPEQASEAVAKEPPSEDASGRAAAFADLRQQAAGGDPAQDGPASPPIIDGAVVVRDESEDIEFELVEEDGGIEFELAEEDDDVIEFTLEDEPVGNERLNSDPYADTVIDSAEVVAVAGPPAGEVKAEGNEGWEEEL